MSTYRAFEVTGTREFALVTRELSGPPPGQVRVRVESCGVCHSDVLAVEGLRAAALRALGGAAAIIATAASGASMSPLLGGLAPRGRMVVVGAAPDPISVQTSELIFGTRSVTGSLTGSSIQNEDNLALSLERGIRAMIEVMPLTEAPKAYERMMSGQARFRVVLDTQA